jgi:hypothetical protein
MSCLIHDRCTCYGAPLQYTATMTTTPASMNSSQFAPQTNNIFVGYEWAAPLVASTSAAWYPLEFIQPPTLHSGQDTLLQSGSHRLDNAHEASSFRNVYHQESHGYEREQKQALRSREQVRFPSHPSVLVLLRSGLTPNLARSAASVSNAIHPGLLSGGLARQLLRTISAALSNSSKWRLCEF